LARVRANLEQACQNSQPNCDRWQILQELMRLEALTQQFPDSGCVALPSLSQAEMNNFCNGELLDLPVVMDIMPDLTGVAVGGSVQLSSIVRNILNNNLPDVPVNWSASPGSTTLASVNADGLVTGMDPGMAAVSAEVEQMAACVGAAASVYVAPKLDGIYYVTTLERRIGPLRSECHTADITALPSPGYIQIGIGGPDPYVPGALNASWSNVGGTSGIMHGGLTAKYLQVGGTLPGSPDVGKSCDFVFASNSGGKGTCAWQRVDMDACWGEDDIKLEYVPP